MSLNRNDILSKQSELGRPLLLDGAMGTYLMQNNLKPDKFLWQSIHNLENAKAVKSVYQQYIDAGSDIITTNTFRTNPSAVKNSNLGITNYEFVKLSVDIALQAKRNLNLIIAGSNAPAEDCYKKQRDLSLLDLEYNHKKHIEMLWNSGVDIILNETFSHWDEIELVCKFCHDNKLPYIISFYFDEDLRLLSGEPLNEAVNFVNDFSPVAVGFNCIKDVSFKKYMDQYPLSTKFGFYFNCGLSSVTEKQITSNIEPYSYIKSIKSLINYNTLFVGSCCGSTPEHTIKIKEFLDEVY
ncbi:MAG: homocysteine S-methyltransferase family protein [Bacteroidota bacterium]